MAGSVDGQISPIAETVPLAGDGRATDGLAPDDLPGPSVETARVKREEMEALLRRAGLEPRARYDAASARPLPAPARPVPATASLVEPASTSEAPAPAVWKRPRIVWPVVTSILLLVVAGALVTFLRRPAASEAGLALQSSSAAPGKPLDARFAQADEMIAAGDVNGAVNLLRDAVALDPSNREAHLRLADALVKAHALSAAIQECRAALQIDPRYTAAWRTLAGAQFEASLYADSAESYQQLVSLGGEREVGEDDWLRYADALRLAERSEAARAIYQRLAATASTDIAEAARQRLAGPQDAHQPASNPETPHNRTAEAAQKSVPERRAAARPAPVRQPTPGGAERDAARRDEDFYRLAMGIVGGRDPKRLSKPELLRALQFFQNVRGGPHRDEALKNAERLGREYDRRRNQ